MPRDIELSDVIKHIKNVYQKFGSVGHDLSELSEIARKEREIKFHFYGLGKIDGLYIPLGQKIISTKNPTRNVFIGVNNNISKTRQTFTLAHELGHYFSHFHHREMFLFDRSQRSKIYYKDEYYANFIAITFIMPCYEIHLVPSSDFLSQEINEPSVKLSFLALMTSDNDETYRLANEEFYKLRNIYYDYDSLVRAPIYDPDQGLNVVRMLKVAREDIDSCFRNVFRIFMGEKRDDLFLLE